MYIKNENMPIPKKIHWCWLSGDPIPIQLQKCIRSWKRVMPDYEIVCWDMQRFDIHSVKFVEDACAHKKWAFAADYIRLHALYTEGGIYLDSDVMVFRRFDKFLHHGAFTSIVYCREANPSRGEDKEYAGYCVAAEILGAEKGNRWIKMCMEHYLHEKVFQMKPGGKPDVEVIPNVLARYAYKYYGFPGFSHFNTPQYLKDGITIYPAKIFSFLWGEVDMTTYAIHLGVGSWCDDKFQKLIKLKSLKQRIYEYLLANYRLFTMLRYQTFRLIKFLKRKPDDTESKFLFID
jgi:hypothetical protein